MNKLFIIFLFLVVIGLGYSIFGLPSNTGECYNKYAGEERSICYYRQSLYQVALGSESDAVDSCKNIVYDLGTNNPNEDMADRYSLAYKCITNVAEEFNDIAACDRISFLPMSGSIGGQASTDKAKDDCVSSVEDKDKLKNDYHNEACAPLFILLGIGGSLIFKI